MFKVNREEMIEFLINHTWDSMDLDDLEFSFKEVMRDGCLGYSKMSDEDLLEEYNAIMEQ